MLMSEFVDEILMSDYIEIGTSDEGFVYVLMNVDKLSKLVEFVPTEATTTYFVWDRKDFYTARS